MIPVLRRGIPVSDEDVIVELPPILHADRPQNTAKQVNRVKWNSLLPDEKTLLVFRVVSTIDNITYARQILETNISGAKISVECSAKPHALPRNGEHALALGLEARTPVSAHGYLISVMVGHDCFGKTNKPKRKTVLVKRKPLELSEDPSATVQKIKRGHWIGLPCAQMKQFLKTLIGKAATEEELRDAITKHLPGVKLIWVWSPEMRTADLEKKRGTEWVEFNSLRSTPVFVRFSKQKVGQVKSWLSLTEKEQIQEVIEAIHETDNLDGIRQHLYEKFSIPHKLFLTNKEELSRRALQRNRPNIRIAEASARGVTIYFTFRDK